MGKGSSTPPPVPDPTRIAQAQGTANIESAIAQSLLNQVNEVTPFGSVSFRQIGGPMQANIPRFERTTTLTPAAQAQFEAQQATGLDLSRLAQENIGAVRAAQQGGLDFQGLPQSVSGINAPPITGFQAPSQQVQSNLQQFDPLSGIDTQGLFGIRQDFAQQGQELEQATFERGRSLLEPQFGRELQRAEVRLSERGLPLSSQVGGDILGDVRASRGRQLNELALASVSAGRQEQQRLFEQAQALRGQQFGERAVGGEFAQRAIGQRFGQGLAAGEFANIAQQQQFGQAVTGQQAANVAQQQSFQQAAANAALQNAARQQGFQERAFLRNIPLNDISALLGTAPGIQAPQFTPIQNVGVAPTDVIGAQLGTAGLAQDRFRTQQQARSGLFGGLFGLAGDIGSSFIQRSDIRLKENIEHYGKLPNGLKLYKYNYVNDNEPQIGVMAQEVEQVIPEAVIEIDGFKAVNYGMVM